MNLSETRKDSLIKILKESLFFIVAFLVTVILYFGLAHVSSNLNIDGHYKGVITQSIFGIINLGLLITVILLCYFKKVKKNNLLLILIIMAFILRLNYILVTPASVRQYDTFSQNHDGHEAYAWTIFETGKLPLTNDYQFYHPPLNACVQAGFMHVVDSVTSLFNGREVMSNLFKASCPSYIDPYRYYLFSSCQILSLMYTLGASVFMIKSVELFEGDLKIKLVPLLLVMFFPRLVELSGQLNNDSLALVCSMGGLYYALKWYKKDKSYLNIGLSALFLGLGMMTKLTSATVCLPIAFLFIYEFYKSIRKREDSLKISKIILEFCLFLVVICPLGLWFQIYAYVRFGQKLGFVFSNLNPELSTAHVSFFERFFITFSTEELFGDIYCRPFDNYNLWNYLIRSAIFGEFHYYNGDMFGVLSIVLAYVTIIISLVIAIRMIFLHFKEDLKNKERLSENIYRRDDLYMMVFLFLSQIGAEIYFYISMPYGCTMDFRYIVPYILFLSLSMLFMSQRIGSDKNKFFQTLMKVQEVLVIVFLTFSSFFYSVII